MPLFGGFESQIQLSFDGGSTYNNLPKLSDLSPDFTADEIDVSNHDTAGWKEYLAGLLDGSVSLEYFLIDSDDAVQTALETAFLAKTTFKAKIRPKVGAGLREYRGDFVCTSLSQTGPTTEGYKVSATLKQRSAITRNTQ